jgi:ribosomal-protein-alanine N-acetyltransferase
VTVASTLRLARRDDLDALVVIERACFGHHGHPDAMSDELARSWARVHVAEHAERGVVAYVTVWRIADEIEVIQVGTRPEARREGHARALLVRVLDEATREGAVRALLEVRPSNVSAVTLYRSLGFETLSRRERYYDDGEDALVMELRLARG